ncbi:MAG: GNAT family N-acetyltransferase, partial [Alphaproteobacteria bacterium]
MADQELHRRVEDVRRFNRFYTGRIGVLGERLLDSRFSLTEARVIYELAHRDEATAAELARELELDAGYMSRILAGFERAGLIDRTRSPEDGRRALLRLTGEGRSAFSVLDGRSRDRMSEMLGGLTSEDQTRLIKAMQAIESVLGSAPEGREPYVLRPHRPGDMGWIVQRHGVLYAEEYGWEEDFEAYCADIVSTFIKNYDPRKERCWIAEIDGEPTGSVMVRNAGDGVARLHLLLVEPRARGLGIGTRLVAECVTFARRAGYDKMILWTNDVL